MISLRKKTFEHFIDSTFKPFCFILNDSNSNEIKKNMQNLGTRGDKSQSTMHAMDQNTGVVMFAQVARNGVSCWNSANYLSENNIGMIDSDNVKMIYPVDLNVSIILK